jgi:hypothetical protein
MNEPTNSPGAMSGGYGWIDRFAAKFGVIGASWFLFAFSDHSDNALSIALGGTVAVLVLAAWEPVWFWWLRSGRQRREHP